MPRKARLSIPGSVTHIMAKCLDGLCLYTDEDDAVFFVSALSRCLIETRCRCYAWALMRNHYHLVIRVGDQELWRTMKPLNMLLAQHYNRKYSHRGPLFMDRYKSIVTQDQCYVQELVRYVHLNPVRAGLCKNLQNLVNYPWTGHRALLGFEQHEFQNTSDVLNRFGKDRESSHQAYLAFLQEGLSDGADAGLIELVRSSNTAVEKGGNPARWVIGDPEFVRQTIQKAQARQLRISRFEREGADFNPVARRVCEACHVPYEELFFRHKGGAGSAARKYFCYAATRKYGAPAKSVAAFLGVHPTAVSAMVRQGRTDATQRLFEPI